MTNTMIPTGGAPTVLPGGQTVTGTVRPEAGSLAHFQQVAARSIVEHPAEFVARIINYGNTDFHARYLTHWYDLPPGGEMVVPWDVMIHFLGDPHSTNAPGRMDRQERLRRLRFKYGAVDDDGAWERQRPKVAAYSVSTGERYNTIVDDPEGTTIHAASTTIADQSALEQQIAALTQQVTVLQQLALANSGGHVNEAPIAPPAGPDGAPVGDFSFTPPDAPRVLDTLPPAAVQLPPATGAVEDAPTRVKAGS